jgi:hypothetical protein
MYRHYIKQAEQADGFPQASKSDLEVVLKGTAPTGQLYSGLGLGGLGALLGAGIGGVTAEKGKRIRNALIGAGIGGAAGGAGGYFLSPHIHPINMAYIDSDKVNLTNLINRYWRSPESTPSLIENRALSVAEILGAAGNINLLSQLGKKM